MLDEGIRITVLQTCIYSGIDISGLFKMLAASHVEINLDGHLVTLALFATNSLHAQHAQLERYGIATTCGCDTTKG